ncbi:MAG: SurA N-terminal domain-containing protein [Paludibacter sp.]|nr:SurA N-terminal domain-containing protein [Paludibacter sp.]MBP7612419.1 SurA N-terminal domain-containing protein [Paludibacter sp.]
MAVLEKIRSKGVLLIGAVGLALLAFIVGDFLNSGSSYFNKSKETVAKIVGEDINIKDYTASIDQMTEVYKIETGKSELNEEMMTQLRTSVWESMVNEKILNAEAKKLGLAVSKEELSDRCIGNNIHPLIQQRRTFAGENGQFSRPLLVQFLNSLEQAPANEEMKQQLAKAKSYWMFWEKTVKNSILQEKYTALISKAVVANSLDAKMSYQDRKTSVDVAYVVQPYYTVSDSAVSVSKSEIKDRYNKQKEQYKQDANCSVNYVAFEIKPLKEDYKEAEAWINKLSTEFKTTDDVVGLVNSNSDVMYNGQNYSLATVPANLKAFAFSGKTGDIVGPMFANETYTMARIMQSGIMQSDSVKLRHIFLVEKDAAKADSLVAAIRAGGDFAAMAKQYSAVKQTAANGGEIGWIQEGVPGMDKEMSAAAFSKATNEVFTLKNPQGVQIMQVMEKTPARSKVKLAILERKVVASSKSQSRIYNDAKQFAVDLTADKFDAKAKEKGYIVHPANEFLKVSDKISDIAQSRKVVQWAFKGDKGDVSDVFECGSTLVVATITDVNEKGYRSIEKLNEQLKAEIIKDKKAELMIKNLTAQLAKTPTLEGLAGSMGDSLKVATGVNFAAYQFGLAGMEPAVIGKSSVIALNKVSAPIKGNAGVFVIRTSNKQVNPQPFNAQMEKMQLNGRMSYALPYMIIQDLKDKADIVDNRINFF